MGQNMRSRLIAAALFIGAIAGGCGTVSPSPAGDEPTTTNLGKKIANLPFTDADGKTTHLYDLKDKKAIVLVFLSFECPVVEQLHAAAGRHGQRNGQQARAPLSA